MFFDILIVGIFVLALAYLISQHKPADFPPGPFGLPIVGHLLQLGQAPYLKFESEWKEKFGPIIGVYFGSYRTVAISDYSLIKEALMDANFAGRPDMPAWHTRSEDIRARGIIFTEGQENVDQKRFIMKCMKEFGNGETIENVLTSEAAAIMSAFEKETGEPISLKNRFHVSILNVLWNIVAGQDCEEDRATLNEIFANCTKIIEENNGLSALFIFLPFFTKYFPTLSGFKYMNKELEPIRKFLGKHISSHKELNKEQPGVQHDVIGAYLNEMAKAKDPNSSFYKEVGERSLMTSLIDLFFAGTETTANTIHWGCLLLATHLRVQEKFQEEIDRVIGRLRSPAASDENDMPYTQAVIQEILRFSSLTPMAVFHSTVQTVEFHGYRIPKDTMILLNFHGAHHDKEYWGDPNVFRPERFLSQDGKTLVKHEAFFPFGAGKRVCVGETLGRKEVFILLTNLFQGFTVAPDPSNPNPSLEPIITFVLIPQDHKLAFNKRALE